jgi:hypothetical protein
LLHSRARNMEDKGKAKVEQNATLWEGEHAKSC